MSYEQQFTQGIENLIHFDSRFSLDEPARELLEKTFRRTSEKALEEPYFGIRQQVCLEAARYAGNNLVDAFAYQCLADSHTFLEASVQQRLVHKNYMTLTIGDVSFDGKPLFNATQATLQSCVSDGISTGDRQRFHVWLTLADMTVIDLSIVAYLVEHQLLSEPVRSEDWLNVWRAERQGRFDYHPLLIDDAFLSRLRRPAH